MASLSLPQGMTTRSQVPTLVHKTQSHPKVHVPHSHTQHAGHTHTRTQAQTHVRKVLHRVTCATTSLRLSSPEEAEPWGRASQHGLGGGTPASWTHAPGPFGVETGRQAPALLWRPQHPPGPSRLTPHSRGAHGSPNQHFSRHRECVTITVRATLVRRVT